MFYNMHFLKIKSSLLFLGVDEDTAIDIAQECFTRLWLRWLDFDTDAARMQFMKVSSRHLWIDKCRKLKHERMYLAHVSEKLESPHQQLHYKELMNAIQEALIEYDPLYQQIYIDIKFHGATYKDVASRTDIHLKTLERHMTQMSKKVRTYIVKHNLHMPSIALLLFF